MGGYDYDRHGSTSYGMNHSDWWMMSLVALICVVVIGALIYLVTRLNKTADHCAHPSHQNRDAAQEALDGRLARGEIDVAEYHERRTALRSP
jgi:uncharacterized membrane protein